MQEEIDSVIGGDRLPTLEDRPRLPYLNAFLKEVFRWNVVTNNGAYAQLVFLLLKCYITALPHVSMADDEYKGFVCKKGTIFLPNVWYELSRSSRALH